MYEQFYGFNAKPFDSSTESDYFYLSQSHKQALLSVHEGLNNGGGFIVITGLLGMGKSSLVEFLKKEQIASNLVIASISGEKIDDMDLLPAILNGFGGQVTDRNLPALIAQVEGFIHSEVGRGKKPLLVVDEAHNLSFRSLEVLRLLSNFQSEGKPSFQVILVGNNELNNMLMDQNHVQLKNQIVSSAKINPLSLSDTKNYVMHHLKRVGWHDKPVLNDNIFVQAQRETLGIPAEINQYFDQLLQREMLHSADPVYSINESSPSNTFNELNQADLMAALDKLNVVRQNPLQNPSEQSSVLNSKAESVDVTADAELNIGLNRNVSSTSSSEFSSGFDAGMSLEDTIRAFEGGSVNSSSKKKTHAGFNWQLVGIVFGSYLLSVVIAISYFYADIADAKVNHREVIMAGMGTVESVVKTNPDTH